MPPPFPPHVKEVAARYGIEPGLAFGLGEGLNLYYSRRFGEVPPHTLHVLPSTFEAKLVQRLAMPHRSAIAASLVGNSYGVMICTGDWHGLDAIEKWGEDISLWPMVKGWEESAREAVRLIRESDGLYRRSYTAFLDEASQFFDNLQQPRALLIDIADDWLTIAHRLEQDEPLDRLGTKILRMAAQESRFWGMILDHFGRGI